MAIQEFTIAQSAQTYQEIAQRIYKPKFDKYISNERREELLNLVKSKSQFIDTQSQIAACRDPDDNKFLELAIDSNAQFFANATSFIRKPATLSSLVTEIENLDWYSARQEGLGDLYEGLLEKNANEKKSGRGSILRRVR